MSIPQRNIARAARIDTIRNLYEQLLEEVPDDETSYLHLASIMADMRHWCDVNDSDFRELVRISEQHYAAEQGEDGE